MLKHYALPLLWLVTSVSGCATPLPLAVECPKLPEPPAVVRSVLSAPPAPSYLESAKTSLDLLNRLIENAPD